jgi:hypothetical protein
VRRLWRRLNFFQRHQSSHKDTRNRHWHWKYNLWKRNYRHRHHWNRNDRLGSNWYNRYRNHWHRHNRFRNRNDWLGNDRNWYYWNWNDRHRHNRHR